MIDGSIYIEDLVNDYPQLIGPLSEMGIVCVACGEPVWGTLNDLIKEKDLENPEAIIDKLNMIITEKDDKK